MEAARILQMQGLRFGPLGPNWVHICVDMQRLFSEGEWQTPWMRRGLPQILLLVEATLARTVFTRFTPVRASEPMPGAWRRYYARWPSMTLDRLEPGRIELLPELGLFAPPALTL